jgi:hypothetical protein
MDCFECMSVCERETVLSMSCISQKETLAKVIFRFLFFYTSTEEMFPFTGGLPRFHFELNQNFVYCTNYWNLEYLN